MQFLILGLVQRRPSSSSNKKKQKNLEYKLINGYNPAGIMPTGSKPFEGRVSLYLFALGSSPYSRPQTIGYLGVRQDGSIWSAGYVNKPENFLQNYNTNPQVLKNCKLEVLMLIYIYS